MEQTFKTYTEALLHRVELLFNGSDYVWDYSDEDPRLVSIEDYDPLCQQSKLATIKYAIMTEGYGA